MRLSICIAILVSLGLLGCVDSPNFDNTPSIQYNSIDKFTIFDTFSQANADSLVITIDFEDGDGDLGVPPEQISDTAFVNRVYKDWGNYELTVFERNEDGTFKLRPLALFSSLFFPVLKRDGKPGPIKGKLDLRQTFPATRFGKLTTVKLQVRIRDRALNVSNVIETDTISIYLD
ncbi:hypothetical protein [Arundinibacter roseus]|uniref:Uncharacterized protein n=1 Tax=Arundinibacter roseus TaxID=2070510 RepID=A0A4R4KMW6_9BACT|nr:hypothetical protein [Arundinibacter roseus]TDB67871.1 hypothetical protein EZE20_02805 [Arundinibacter roseus]